jgi:hypothetical protein
MHEQDVTVRDADLAQTGQDALSVNDRATRPSPPPFELPATSPE